MGKEEQDFRLEQKGKRGWLEEERTRRRRGNRRSGARDRAVSQAIRGGKEGSCEAWGRAEKGVADSKQKEIIVRRVSKGTKSKPSFEQCFLRNTPLEAKTEKEKKD